MKSGFFSNQILPGFIFKNIHISKPAQLENIIIEPLQNIEFSPNKRVLIILSIDKPEHDGISEQSLVLQKKILSALQIQVDKYILMQKIDKNISIESLMSDLELKSSGKLNIIFLIGASVTQHFLGENVKISQAQGKVFEQIYRNSTYYFIPLYHPDFISLNASIKSLTWESVKTLLPWIKKQFLSH